SVEGVPNIAAYTSLGFKPMVDNDYSTFRLGVSNVTGGGGSTIDFVAHGYVYFPQALVKIRNNLDSTRLLSGINAGRLAISTSTNTGGFSISIKNRPVPRTEHLVATASDPFGGRT